MEVKILERSENYLRFLIDGIDVSVANSLRRIMIAEVPSMAIDDVIIIENSSPMNDEALAHRLGLIPFKTDLDSYVLPDECDCSSELGCSRCSVTLTLEAAAREGARTVYSKELKSADPNIVPVSGKIPIVKLARGQKVRLEAYAKLGLGLGHAKWQPVSQCTYKYASEVTVNRERCDLCGKCVEACLRHVLELDGEVKVAEPEKCNLCGECKKVCPRDAVRAEQLKDSFIFSVESSGALKPERVFLESIRILMEKTDDLMRALTRIGKGDA